MARHGVTVERPCTWVVLGDDPLDEVLAFAEGHARPGGGGTVVVRCPVTRRTAVMEDGDGLVRWDDGTYTVMSGRALGKQVRETGPRG